MRPLKRVIFNDMMEAIFINDFSPSETDFDMCVRYLFEQLYKDDVIMRDEIMDNYGEYYAYYIRLQQNYVYNNLPF